MRKAIRMKDRFLTTFAIVWLVGTPFIVRSHPGTRDFIATGIGLLIGLWVVPMLAVLWRRFRNRRTT